MKAPIRIKDIAEKAGVSVGTVDRVIHNRGNVSGKAREKVERVMKELDYTPNIMARTLASNRRLRIAVLLPRHPLDLYWALPELGVKKALQGARHYGIEADFHFFDLFSPQDFEYKARTVLDDQRPDAVLMAPIFYQESVRFVEGLQPDGPPVVFINTDISEAGVLSYIGQDSYQSGVLAGRLLDLVIGPFDGNVLLLNLAKVHSKARHLLDKEDGFRHYFKDSAVEVARADFADFDRPEWLKEFIWDQRNQLPDLRGIFVTNSRAYRLLESSSDLLKGIRTVGFDLLPRNLTFLEEKKLDFLINQHPVQQGYLGFMSLVNRLIFQHSVPRLQHLPLDIVVTENMTYYLQREKEFQVFV